MQNFYKLISLSCFFILTCVSSADGAAKSDFLSLLNRLPGEFRLRYVYQPIDGMREDSFKSGVILLGNLSQRYADQKNQMKMIDRLIGSGASELILVTGGSGNLSIDFLKGKAAIKDRYQRGLEFLGKKRMQGYELHHLISDSATVLIGVDADYTLMRFKLAKNDLNNKIMHALNILDEKTDEVRPEKSLHPAYQLFDLRKQLVSSHIPLSAYLRGLFMLSEQRSTGDQLRKLKEFYRILEEFETGMDWDGLLYEYQKFNEEFPGQMTGWDLAVSPLYLREYKKISGDSYEKNWAKQYLSGDWVMSEEYPLLSRWMKFLTGLESFPASRFEAETDRAEDRIVLGAPDAGEDFQAHQALRSLRIYRSILASISEKPYSDYGRTMSELKSAYIALLRHHPVWKDSIPGMDRGISAIQNSMVDLTAALEKRAEQIAVNIEKISGNKKKNFILIADPEIYEALLLKMRQKDITLAVIEPATQDENSFVRLPLIERSIRQKEKKGRSVLFDLAEALSPGSEPLVRAELVRRKKQRRIGVKEVVISPDESLKYLRQNMSSSGLPRSFSVPEDASGQRLFKRLSPDERRTIAYRLNLYDGALWQLALTHLGESTDQKRSVRLLNFLTGEWTEELKTLKAAGPQYLYGDNEVILPDSRAYFFRFISDVYNQPDPLGGPGVHNDWQPTTAEQAWIAFIAPLNMAAKNVIPLGDALSVGAPFLYAFEAMQSTSGAVYHAPKGAYGRDSESFSANDQLVLYAALELYKEAVKNSDQKLYLRARNIQAGVLRFLRTHLYDYEAGRFFSGGKFNQGSFEPSDYPAVDTGILAMLVFDPKRFDAIFGKNSYRTLWHDVESSIQTDSSGFSLGVAYSSSGAVSVAWSAAALIAVRNYAATIEVDDAVFAASLRQKCDEIRLSLERIKSKAVRGAYHAVSMRSKSFYGWWDNPVPSIGATAWMLLADAGINPFKPFY